MLTASVNIGPLLGKLQKLGLATRRPMQELVREQARLFISSSGNVPGMVQVTPPFSPGTRGIAAKKQGENKVRSDIAKVYATEGTTFEKIPDPRVRKAWWKAVKNGNTAEAERLVAHLGTEVSLRIKPFDAGAAHVARRRRYDGNVSGRTPDFIVSNPKDLEKYVRAKVANVGTLASGFNAAAASLGARGIPAWITRHGTRFSGISIQTGNTSFYIIISDKVPFAQVATAARMQYILRYRDAALKRSMPHIIRNAIKRAGFAATLT